MAKMYLHQLDQSGPIRFGAGMGEGWPDGCRAESTFETGNVQMSLPLGALPFFVRGQSIQ